MKDGGANLCTLYGWRYRQLPRQIPSHPIHHIVSKHPRTAHHSAPPTPTSATTRNAMRCGAMRSEGLTVSDVQFGTVLHCKHNYHVGGWSVRYTAVLVSVAEGRVVIGWPYLLFCAANRTAQIRAAASRAEQSRAEQSAEQTRAGQIDSRTWNTALMDVQPDSNYVRSPCRAVPRISIWPVRHRRAAPSGEYKPRLQ